MTHIKTDQEPRYNFAEFCPECETFVPIVIDDDDYKTYAVTCPTCGRKLMLCTLCRWDEEKFAGQDTPCDWCEENGCWRERGEKCPWPEQEGETNADQG